MNKEQIEYTAIADIKRHLKREFGTIQMLSFDDALLHAAIKIAVDDAFLLGKHEEVSKSLEHAKSNIAMALSASLEVKNDNG